MMSRLADARRLIPLFPIRCDFVSKIHIHFNLTKFWEYFIIVN